MLDYSNGNGNATVTGIQVTTVRGCRPLHLGQFSSQRRGSSSDLLPRRYNLRRPGWWGLQEFWDILRVSAFNMQAFTQSMHLPTLPVQSHPPSNIVSLWFKFCQKWTFLCWDREGTGARLLKWAQNLKIYRFLVSCQCSPIHTKPQPVEAPGAPTTQAFWGSAALICFIPTSTTSSPSGFSFLNSTKVITSH